MSTYHPHGVKLSEGQRKKLAKAYRDNSAITIRLSNDELSGSDQLMLTNRQIAKLKKAKSLGNGSDVKISKTQIGKVVAHGGSLWSSLFSLGTKLLPYATTAVSKVAPSLATGALSALGSLGIDKIFGKKQKGGFLIPQNKIDKLIANKHLLSKKQKEDILAALQSGSDVVIKPTTKQSGGFLGTLLASIGIPMVLKALTGSGLHVEKSRPRRSIPVYAPPTKGKGKNSSMMLMPYQPPPFFGSWKNPIGYGIKKSPSKKKEKGKRSSAWSKQSIQQHSVGWSHFVNKPLSSYDLKNWVKQLGIKYFKGVLSKDVLPKQIKNKECGIINLDDYIKPGTHWVCYRNIDRFCEYFDSFGLMMPTEVSKYMATSGKQLVYSGDEIQAKNVIQYYVVIGVYTIY